MTVAYIGPVALGNGPVKVIVPVMGRTDDDVHDHARQLVGRDVDVVEWRIDTFRGATNPEAVLQAGNALVDATDGLPLLCTFRSAAEGGASPVTPDEYVAVYEAVIAAGIADAVDVEVRFDPRAGDAVRDLARDARIPVIGSWHDFQSTPPLEDFLRIIMRMRERGFDVGKVAATPTDAADVFALLHATAVASAEEGHLPVLAMAMGALGTISRLAAPVSGSCATFATVGEQSAPGQIPLEDVRTVLSLLERAQNQN